ncbi:hypothetical protein GJ496_008514 [Pomphorhynchus laevis]|nr:hypothetical protein GJ496_008514 [Pomphorhynchus laevis]
MQCEKSSEQKNKPKPVITQRRVMRNGPNRTRSIVVEASNTMQKLEELQLSGSPKSKKSNREINDRSSSSSNTAERIHENKAKVQHTRNQRHDPVTTLKNYREIWKKFKIPGECQHLPYRWAIKCRHRSIIAAAQHRR